MGRGLAEAILALMISTTGLAAVSVNGQSIEGPPVSVAVMDETALNPFHEEFRWTGQPPAWIPVDVVVPFEAHRWDLGEESPLRALPTHALVWIEGTRVLAFGAYDAPTFDLLGSAEHRRHGTGSMSALLGSTTGTAVDALGVFTGGVGAKGYEWVAESPWIDVVSVSVFAAVTLSSSNGSGSGSAIEELTCASGDAIRRTQERGALVVASAGNTDLGGAYAVPNALPGVYRVGGANPDGTPESGFPDGPPPDLLAAEDPVEDAFFWLGFSSRTFDTSDRFDFQAASGNDNTSFSRYGGTSGAAPTTAGRATNLIRHARAILGDTSGPESRPAGVLALMGRSNEELLPASGPLSDGDFTAPELASLLRSTARPSLSATPGRYFYEGYGVRTRAEDSHAVRVLRGEQAAPPRAEDDADRDADTHLRELALTGRCP